MTTVGQLTRRVTFQQRAANADGDRLGAWADIVSRAARVAPLRTGAAGAAETVINMRLEGNQPVLITVRRDATTKLIDNTYRAYDARGPAPTDPAATVWNVTAGIWNEAEDMMEFLAVERRGGSDA